MKYCKKIFMIIFFLVFNLFLLTTARSESQLAFQSSTEETGSKVICEVTGIEEIAGTLRVTLDSESSEFKNKKKPFRIIEAPVKNKSQKIEFDNVPPGQYAIKVFLDENSDGVLNLSIFGIPKEKYGISRDARGRFGLPEFEEASFLVNSQESVQSIVLRHHALF